MRTRVVELRQELARLRDARPRTTPTGQPPPRATGSVLTHWSQIQARLAAIPDPGLALFAIDTHLDTVSGTWWLAAKPGRPTVGVVGRHRLCDLELGGDAELSLRHLAIVLEVAPAGGASSYRLLDLRTGLAFVDEAGRVLEAATARGPAFVRVGRYLLVCFPSGGEPWPLDVVAAAARLPERRYVDLRDAEPGRWSRSRPGLAAGTLAPLAAGARLSPAAVLAAVHGPARARVDLRGAGDALAGTLTVRSPLGCDVIEVGGDALARGLLLGRYHRCDGGGGASSLALERVSRIHALVLASGGRVWIIDLASTNGLAVDGRPVRVHPLDDGAVVGLGGAATVGWAGALDDAAL